MHYILLRATVTGAYAYKTGLIQLAYIIQDFPELI